MIYKAELEEVALKLSANGKGILAADESNATAGKRLASIDTENSEENRRRYRDILFSTPELGAYIGGVILYDETIRQSAADGTSFVQGMQKAGMIPGIKVDTGAKVLAGSENEKITEGLDGLRDRLKEYYDMGARFAKWRAVITIDQNEHLPSQYCLDVNAHALARYAALCQEASIVPIVEPEVIMDGPHTIETCYKVTSRTLRTVFGALLDQKVVLENILLKPNMVISGSECKEQASVEEVARKTLDCFRKYVPAAVPGIVFLSGGQSDELATAHLNAMQNQKDTPWHLSYSYGRALQAPALKSWAGKDENVAAAQQQLAHRAKLNSLAARGQYDASME